MRINLLGGPGSGKSTTAAWLFSILKENHISVELVTEYVKSWACQKRQVTSFDQIYLLGKQMQYEYRFLNAGIKNIVTDSPVFLSSISNQANGRATILLCVANLEPSVMVDIINAAK